jgi:hypothetical protein
MKRKFQIAGPAVDVAIFPEEEASDAGSRGEWLDKKEHIIGVREIVLHQG